MEELLEIMEILERLEISPELFQLLEKEEIICPLCLEDRPGRFLPREMVDDLRIAKVLIEDLGVNIEGVDIILRLRRQILQMQGQFQRILEDLREFVKSLEGHME